MFWFSDEFLIEAYNSRSGGRMAARAVAGWQVWCRVQAVLCTGHWAAELGDTAAEREREDQNRLLSRVPV